MRLKKPRSCFQGRFLYNQTLPLVHTVTCNEFLSNANWGFSSNRPLHWLLSKKVWTELFSQSKNSDWKIQISLEFRKNCTALCSSDKIFDLKNWGPPSRSTTRILLTTAAFRMRSQTARNKTLVMIKSRRYLCRRATKIRIASVVILLASGILLASLLIPCKYSIHPNRHVCTFISGKVRLLILIEAKRQTLPEINVYTRLFGSIEKVGQASSDFTK